jgi:hypothetical protein
MNRRELFKLSLSALFLPGADIAQEIPRWKKVVQSAKITVE